MASEATFYIYRSRFQPEFATPHKYAVEKFFDLKKNLPLEKAQLVLGIVDEELFVKSLSDRIEKQLETMLGKTYGSYKVRFTEELNPSNIGEIKRTIWDNWRNL
jgi:hypothetical protein